jgi:hypothetical protein
MKTIEGETTNGMTSHAEEENEMDQEFRGLNENDRVYYRQRQRNCLGDLEGFLTGRCDDFFKEVDWPMENEASAEKFLSDAGVPKDVKKAFVLISPRQEKPNWKVSYILLKRNGNLSEEEIERDLEEREGLSTSSRRIFKIIVR